jgi:hypothetical protein
MCMPGIKDIKAINKTKKDLKFYIQIFFTFSFELLFNLFYQVNFSNNS